MYRICVVTATRAEYGLLKRTIQQIIKNDELELILVVTGTHLDSRFGYTVREIENDGYEIAEKIDILSGEEQTECGICSVMGKATTLFGEMFERQKPDMLIVEGDRYELLSICSSAMIFGIPIAHISGGEITEGAIDDCVRHCLTKMSYLHFPACEEYRQRIIQMGESPDRVFNFGDVGVENIRKMDFLTKKELGKELGISLDLPYASVTFHPVTREKNSVRDQIMELVTALGHFKQMMFIVSMSNADFQGDVINQIFEASARSNENIVCYSSLGIKRYLSLLKNAQCVIGNSSSGIVEAPCFGIPTINIGSRQAGRLKAASIIDCEPVSGEIVASIERALSPEFKKIAKKAKNPYGSGDTSTLIVGTIARYLKDNRIDLEKKFFDIPDQGK